jgi:hypothetical protein
MRVGGEWDQGFLRVLVPSLIILEKFSLILYQY